MKNLREKFRKTRLAAGLAIAGLTWMFSSTAMVQASAPVAEVQEADAAYAQNSESKTEISKKTSKKTTSKKVTMKKASDKTYTKELPAQKKTSSKTVKNTSSTVKTDTTVVTQATEKYTKKSKVKVVNTTVTTTVVTTTTKAASTIKDTPGTSVPNVTAPGFDSRPGVTVEKPQAGRQVLAVASAAPMMDSRVINAYQKLGFSLYSDSSVSYAGYFNAKDRSIILRRNDDTVYHELGHFLSFIAGNMDKSAAFVSVYNQEKNSYTGSNKAYVTQNSSEYFAESVRDYVKNPAALRSARPMTYAAMEEALAKVTDAQISRIQLIYGPVWR